MFGNESGTVPPAKPGKRWGVIPDRQSRHPGTADTWRAGGNTRDAGSNAGIAPPRPDPATP